MGLHWEASESQSTIINLWRQCDAIRPVLQHLKVAVTSLQNDIGPQQPLAGKAYQTLAASLDENFVPVLKSFEFLCDALTRKIGIYERAQTQLQHYGSILDEEMISHEICGFEGNRNILSNLQRNSPAGRQHLQQRISKYEHEIKRQREKIRALRQAEAETKGLFTPELQVFTDLTKALAAIKSGHFNSAGAFITTDNKKWLDGLKKYILKQENSELKQLKYPAGLSKAGKKQYREQVSKQIDALKKKGWSKQSVIAYVEYLNQHPQSEQEEVDRKHLTSIYEQTKTVGTQVFLSM